MQKLNSTCQFNVLRRTQLLQIDGTENWILKRFPLSEHLRCGNLQPTPVQKGDIFVIKRNGYLKCYAVGTYFVIAIFLRLLRRISHRTKYYWSSNIRGKTGYIRKWIDTNTWRFFSYSTKHL